MSQKIYTDRTDLEGVEFPSAGQTRLLVVDENKKIKSEVNAADQVSYDNTASGLLAETVQEAVDEVNGKLSKLGFVQRTGTAIAFDKWATYGTYATPVSGNLSYSFADMVKGMIQVMYHQASTPPTTTQVGVVKTETGDYVIDRVNKITIHCVDEDVIEITIKTLE